MIRKLYSNLFVGDSQSPYDEVSLRMREISSVVNVAFDLNDKFDKKIDWYKVGLIDGEGNKEHKIRVAYKLVANLLANGENILIHCHEGKSRSVYISFLVMISTGLTAADAEGIIHSKLPDNKLDKLLQIYGVIS